MLFGRLSYTLAATMDRTAAVAPPGADEVARAFKGTNYMEVQQVGRWEDQRMPAHYARHEAVARNGLARYHYGQ